MSENHVGEYRKELLFRRANGKKILGAYLSKVAVLFPSLARPELLSLEETDLILERFRLVCADLRQEKIRIPAGDVHSQLSAIRNFGGGFYVLVDEDWKYCGLLKVGAIETLNVLVEFGGEILNDLVFISTDMSLVVDFDFFEMNGLQLIDIKKWCK
ncbi:hypothetical protein KEC55_01945 [Burkholderia cepacia]|uniref:hypothetical protein n=1 Tax=Burkholderia cepacia TaxID=292 RepID=UPI00249DFE08|nr:hypothetical protein [Burkholderia cepacia]WGY68780.1 hypothetical protein KEC55_01945 [Burkholderia cepacia]